MCIKFSALLSFWKYCVVFFFSFYKLNFLIIFHKIIFFLSKVSHVPPFMFPLLFWHSYFLDFIVAHLVEVLSLPFQREGIKLSCHCSFRLVFQKDSNSFTERQSLNITKMLQVRLQFNRVSSQNFRFHFHFPLLNTSDFK